MKKFFYDYYDKTTDIDGMYSLPHFIILALFFGGLVFLLYRSRRLTDKQVDKLYLGITIGVTVCEVVKISIRLYKNQPPNDWLPLFYCSLFLFASWFALSKWEWLRRAGYAYMTMGGVTASIFYIIYPSTGLAIYPWWHPAPLHGVLYHFAMCYTGLLLLIKGKYTPTLKDGIYYSVFILLACVPSYFLNESLGSNCMFLDNPYALPIIDWLEKQSHLAYMVVVALAQSVGMYALNYGVYRLILRFINPKRKVEKS